MTTIPNFHKVDGVVYRSGIVTYENFDDVLRYGIKTIVSLKLNIIDTHKERECCNIHNIEFLNIPTDILYYSESTKQQLWRAYYAVVERRKPILVHCTRGSDRTGLVVALYRMFKNYWDVEDAIKEMDKLGFNPALDFWKEWLHKIK